MRSSAARTRAAEPPLVEGEFAFTRGDFSRVSAMLYEDAGISLSEAKTTLVYSRLAKRLRALGLADFESYCDLVASPDGEDERKRMLNALTTNLTRFYREPHHFEHLREHVLEPMAAQIRAGGRLRIWSAGCSSGQEPFSIALTVLGAIPEAASLDVKILATDIDTNVLAHGREATYGEDCVAPIPPNLRSRWLERGAERGMWRLAEAARSMVSFKPLNLMGDWPMKGPFDAIFCRNVAIYFDEPTQERLWNRFRDKLGAQGRLYIGHSERLGGASGGYLNDGLTVYRKRVEAAR